MKKVYLSVLLAGMVSTAMATAIEDFNSAALGGIGEPVSSSPACGPAGRVNATSSFLGTFGMDVVGSTGGCNTMNVAPAFYTGSAGQALELSQPAAGNADFYIIWDGAGTGLGSITINQNIAVNAGTDVGSPRFRVLLYGAAIASGGIGGTADAYLAGPAPLFTSGWQTISTSLTSSSSLLQYVFSVGAPVSGVNAIVLEIDGNTNNSDTVIDFVAADVPEPTTFALVGAALVGLAALRRRS